ncbi:MAG: synthase subunit epsilon [Burkholderiales bacterium]|jgi:F-type H+-transporting ATPase subunit epsilon|nr:synthase subunit epsilon [Burkholderiales bacterium]
MPKLMQVTLVDSEHQIFSGEVEHLVINASNGELGIYPNHIPLICKLKPGILRLQIPNEKYQQVYAVSGGFLEVQGNHATILADIVERTDKLDESRLIAEHNAAIARVKHAKSASTPDIAKAQIALEVAIAQLKALDYIKKHAKR